MAGKKRLRRETYLSLLSENERKEIEQKVDFELKLTNYNTLKKMTLVGAIANALGGLFFIWTLYDQVDQATLFNWYKVLLLFNLLNIAWSAYFGYRYKHITPRLLKAWLLGLYFILSGLTLTWGCIGILFMPQDAHSQLFVITFLQIVALCFSFGSIVDFTLALICINGIILPTVCYQIFKATQHVGVMSYDYFSNVTFSISLLILGVFLLVVCYIGNRLTISQASLSLLNAALNDKLDYMNKFLEQRVKERTFELEESLKLVTYQATHDLLTDLPNQRLLIEYINSAIDSYQKKNRMFAVASFSINELEKINDGLGHQAGDLVIKTIAMRFKKALEKTTDAGTINQNMVTLSRKDTFVILLNSISKLEEIEAKAETLFSILDEPIATEKQTVKLTASIGITIYPLDGPDIQSLLMNADAAMLNAKKRGGNSLNFYTSEINADISRQLQMECNLHNAVKNSEFVLQYQPLINLKTGKICGAEALVRWHHPLLGLISPVDFIPLAERNGIIIPLGEWILRTACNQAKFWHERGFGSLKIAVNLSAKQLQQKNALEIITGILEETKLDPECLELELTETEAFQADVIPILKQLKAMGLSLSIDDFGTGYSGLTNLKLFSIDTLKIDKSFVQDVVTNVHSKAIIANTINLAKKLDITVLAEGVETTEQLQFLFEHGCDVIQGYYFSTPIDPDTFTEILQKNKKFDI